MGPGQALAVPGPDGNQYQVVVPPCVGPGGLFEAELPIGRAPRPSVPMGAPVPQQQTVVVQAPQPQQQLVVYNENVTITSSPAELKHRLLPDSIDESLLTLVMGLCCCNTSLLCSNGCFGLAAKAGICCLEAEVCFKCNTPRLPCCCCALRAVPISTCVKGQAQTCCLVHSFAFPPDDEVSSRSPALWVPPVARPTRALAGLAPPCPTAGAVHARHRLHESSFP